MTGPEIYSPPHRRAIDLIPHDARAELRTNYLPDEGSELRVLAMIERVERQIRDVGSEVTIRTVWLGHGHVILSY